MQQTIATTSDAGNAKAAAKPEFMLTAGALTSDGSPPQPLEKDAAAPVPPPVWARYIDSRLKQFCTR